MHIVISKEMVGDYIAIKSIGANSASIVGQFEDGQKAADWLWLELGQDINQHIDSDIIIATVAAFASPSQEGALLHFVDSTGQGAEKEDGRLVFVEGDDE